MLSFLPTLLFLFAIFFGCSEIEAHGEKRIDEEPKYEQYQDIYRIISFIWPEACQSLCKARTYTRRSYVAASIFKCRPLVTGVDAKIRCDVTKNTVVYMDLVWALAAAVRFSGTYHDLGDHKYLESSFAQRNDLKMRSVVPTAISFIPNQDLFSKVHRWLRLGAQAFKDINDSSDFYWLYGFNYDSPHTKGKSCVYFDIEYISRQGMNYSSRFFRNETKGTYPYTGNFTFTPAIYNYGSPIRKEYNNLHADLRSGDSWPMDYNLIYSDYVNCSIFRVPSIDQGNGCMILVTDSKARSGMPKECKSMYRNACDRETNRWHQIFGNNCTKQR